MTIQEHLSAFDRWLTSRIEEAQAGRKDLAFRDLLADGPDQARWEYSLLEPGARSPHGEGWSVYRLHGLRPEPIIAAREPHEGAAARKSLLSAIAGALFGKGDPTPR